MEKADVMQVMERIQSQLEEQAQVEVLAYLEQYPRDEEVLKYIISHDLVELQPFSEELTEDSVIAGIKPTYKNYLNNVKED